MSRSLVETPWPQYNEPDLARVMGSFDLFVDPQDESIAQWLLKDGYWESWITTWFTRVVEPNWNCLDVGASFGYYTGILSSLAPDGQVFAVEPNPEIVKMLNKSKARNAWKNVTILPYAAGAEPSTMELVVPNSVQGGASLKVFKDDFGPSLRYDVEVKTLDSMTDQKIDFMKIDVEGFEPEVLAGATRILSGSPLIAIEVLSNHQPSSYVDYLFDNFYVTNINFEGSEDGISKEAVLSTEWSMLVLRKD